MEAAVVAGETQKECGEEIPIANGLTAKLLAETPTYAPIE